MTEKYKTTAGFHYCLENIISINYLDEVPAKQAVSVPVCQGTPKLEDSKTYWFIRTGFHSSDRGQHS
jgi:hypothetical protein